MSPGNVAGIAAQRRVKCNGSEAEDVPNKNTTKDTLGFPSCSNMVDDCGMVCSKSNDFAWKFVQHLHFKSTLVHFPKAHSKPRWSCGAHPWGRNLWHENLAHWKRQCFESGLGGICWDWHSESSTFWSPRSINRGSYTGEVWGVWGLTY